MSVAGKKLQDIYDAGAQKLSELERSQRSLMKSQVDGALDAGTTLASDAGKQLQKRATDCRVEIEETLHKTVDQIEKVIESETLGTQKRLSSLKDNIASLTRQLKDSVDELKESHLSRLNVVSEDVAHLCDREFDNASSELHIQDYSSAKTLKVQNTFVLNTFQQKLDHGLLETRGEEKQINSRISKTFLQSVNMIDTQTASWLEKLSQAFDNHSEELESQFKTGDSSLAEDMKALSTELDKFAQDLEQRIHEYFERVSFSFKDTGEERSKQLVEEINQTHKTAADDLSKLTRELAGQLDSNCDSVAASLRQTASDLKSKVDNSVSSVESECKKRSESSLALKKELEGKAQDLTNAIRAELSLLNNNFEKRLKSLVESSAKELGAICSEAETSISTAQGDCESQFKALSTKAKEQIQNKLSEILLRIKRQQDAALDEVRKVAVKTTDAEEFGSAVNPAPKRVKKKKKISASGSDGNGQEGES